MESGRRRRSSSRSSSSSGESSGSRNGSSGSSSSSRRRRSSSSSGSSRRSDFRDDASSGKKALFLTLTLGGIAALGVAFYFVFSPAGSTQNPAPTPSPTPAPELADGATPPGPPKNLGLSMEQYLDKLDSFGDHLQEQGDFAKSVVHAHVDWLCKVYSSNKDSPVKSVMLLSAASTDDKYRVNAFFYNPDAALINRLRLLQRGDIVRLTGAINEDDTRVIDGDNLVLSN